MRNFLLVCLCVLTLAVAVPAQAATITWGAPVLADYGTEAQVLNDLTPVGAITMYGSNVTISGATGGALTFDGYSGATGSTLNFGTSPITMTYDYLGALGGSVQANGPTATDYNKLLNRSFFGVGGFFDNPQPPNPYPTASINMAVVPGQAYRVQVFAPRYDNGYNITLDGGNDISMGAWQPWVPTDDMPTYRVGTFTADGTSQTIVLSSGAPFRFLPGAVALQTTIPEPSTVILLATGLLGLLAYAWRRRRA